MFVVPQPITIPKCYDHPPQKGSGQPSLKTENLGAITLEPTNIQRRLPIIVLGMLTVFTHKGAFYRV